MLRHLLRATQALAFAGALFLCALSARAQVYGGGGGGGGGVSNIATSCGLIGGPITGTGTISIASVLGNNGADITAATYTVQGNNQAHTDCGSELKFTGSSASTWTLGQAGSTGFPYGYGFTVLNAGTANITVNVTTSTLSPGGASSFVVHPNETVGLFANSVDSAWDVQWGGPVIWSTATGGTGASTVNGARTNLGVDQITHVPNASFPYQALATDHLIEPNSDFAAAGTITLPASAGVNDGDTVTIWDGAKVVGAVNTLTVAANGSDTVGGTTQMNAAGGALTFKLDKTTQANPKWTGYGSQVNCLSGQVILGQGSGSANACETVSGDGTIANTGAITVNKVNNLNPMTAGTTFSVVNSIPKWFANSGAIAEFQASNIQDDGAKPTYGGTDTIPYRICNTNNTNGGTSATSVTGTASETVIYACKIPASTMGLNSTLLVTADGTETNNGDTKTLKIRVGTANGIAGTLCASSAITSNAGFAVRNWRFSNVASVSANICDAATTPANGVSGTAAATAPNLNTGSDIYLVITGTLGTTTDTITATHVVVELEY